MSKNSIIAIIALFVLIIGILAVQLYKVEKQTPSREYLQSQQDSLMREIRRTQRLVQNLKVELSLHDDTIRMIERQIPIIKNNYYQNEKVYLSSSDSINRELRLRNQLQFEQDYFSGRFSPPTK
jgi:septal ring factor EnvC (AmiA/AmiB activator)